MPWLNDLPPCRLEREFSSLATYLSLLGELPWRVVWRQMMAFLQVTVCGQWPIASWVRGLRCVLQRCGCGLCAKIMAFLQVVAVGSGRGADGWGLLGFE